MAEMSLAQIAKAADKAYNEGVSMYLDVLFKIANDIYDSCIKQYYATYTPTVYTRHGNIEGFNLYYAKNIETDEYGITQDFDGGDAYELLKYGTKEDIRQEVLDAVMSGKRGIGKRASGKRKWQRNWVASYPNKFSEYTDWKSNASTINEIFDDFDNNILADTKDLKMQLIKEQFIKHLR